MASEAEVAAMRRAIALGSRGLGATSPNPVVGCVVLDRDGRVAGEGFHERAGGLHAEVAALAGAGPRARGGTVVVTLEPCDHTGRTAPCTAALRTAGVARVVVAVRDPHPAARGGAETLRAGGVDVEVGVLAEEAARSNEVWLTATRLGRAHVTWKYAASLDRRVAAADGSSKWVSGEDARADVQRLRAEADAIMVGSGTVLADDPRLTVRRLSHGVSRRKPLLRVVVDTNAKTPASARVLDEAAPTLLAVAPDADARHLPDVVRLPRAAHGLDLRALLVELYRRDVRGVLLEGGPTLAGSFLAEGLIDRVVGYLAPLLVGGGGIPALAGPGVPTLAAAPRLRLDDVRRVGRDVRLTARFLEE